MAQPKLDKEALFWERFADFYDAFMGRAYRTQYKALLKVMEDELDKSKRVLEVGSGTGAVALGVASKVGAVVACDISPRMIGIGERKSRALRVENVVFSVQSAYSIDFPENSFDVAVACNVLHVVRNPERVLASLKRVLKEEGVLIAPTYCHGQNFAGFLVSRILSLAGLRVYSRWSASSLREYLQDQGFSVVRSRLFESTPPMLYVVCHKGRSA